MNSPYAPYIAPGSELPAWRDGPSVLVMRGGGGECECRQGCDKHRPAAVVIGFSLGCKIAHYFLHFCESRKGKAWVDKYVAHFVALGGPFLGTHACPLRLPHSYPSLACPPRARCVPICVQPRADRLATLAPSGAAGSVKLMRSMMVDGSFPPLDTLFSEVASPTLSIVQTCC